MMGVNLTAGGALDWFRSSLCDDIRPPRGKSVFDVLNKEATAVAAGSDGLYFLPYLTGERTPHADPLAKGCFVGLTLSHSRGHMARSVMEGVTYAMRDSLTIIEDLGVPVRECRVSGGGSKSKLWRQLQADVFGKKAVTINAEEGPAYGVALLAAVGDGAYKNIQQACDATVRVLTETPVQRSQKRKYDRRFPVYQRLYHALKEDFKRIAAAEG